MKFSENGGGGVVRTSFVILNALIGALLASVVASPIAAQGEWSPADDIESINARITDQNGYNYASGQACTNVILASFGESATRADLQLNLCSPSKNDRWRLSSVQEFGKFLADGFNAYSSSFLQSTAIGTAVNVSLPGASAYVLRGNKYVTQSDGSRYRAFSGVKFATQFFHSDGSSPGYVTHDGVRIRVFAGQGTGARMVYRVGSSTPYYSSTLGELTYPDGEIVRYYYDMNATAGPEVIRPRYIVSSKGYAVAIKYLSDSVSSSQWGAPARVIKYNKRDVYCDETLSGVCASVLALPSSATFSYNTASGSVDIATASGETMRVKLARDDDGALTSLVQSWEVVGVPGSTVSYSYLFNRLARPSFYEVSEIHNLTGTWLYEYTDTSSEYPDDEAFATRTDPTGNKVHVTTMPAYGVIVSYTDELLRRTEARYELGSSSSGLPAAPAGLSHLKEPHHWGEEQVTYDIVRDGRGNALTVTKNARSGFSGTIEQSAVFPAECLNYLTCNKPVSITDARGGLTEYQYGTTHGMVTKVVGPSVGGVRPETRYTWAQRYAWVKAGSGYAQAMAPTWVLISEEYCRTSAADASGNCLAGAADETVTTYEYEAGSASKGSNLLLLGVTVTSGGQSLRTCYRYDEFGRRISETKPAAGLSSCS